jgi:hypothetical protein
MLESFNVNEKAAIAELLRKTHPCFSGGMVQLLYYTPTTAQKNYYLD